MRLLLDTCTFLWLAQQPDKISRSAAQLINEQDNELFLSEVSVLEIVMKHSAGKLPLPKNPRDWIPEKIKFHQLISQPILPGRFIEVESFHVVMRIRLIGFSQPRRLKKD